MQSMRKERRENPGFVFGTWTLKRWATRKLRGNLIVTSIWSRSRKHIASQAESNSPRNFSASGSIGSAKILIQSGLIGPAAWKLRFARSRGFGFAIYSQILH